MRFEETQRIIAKLKASYYIDTRTEAVQVWHTHLMQFDAGTVDDAVMDYIASEKKTPTIADIVERCKAVMTARRQIADPNARTVKCPYCHDLGLIVYESPTGLAMGRPCTQCRRGRERYPWEFMTRDEKQAYREAEAKKGRIVPVYHEASDEFYKVYTGLKPYPQ